MNNLLKNYNLKEITIGVLGGHSALDVCAGAKKLGFQTLVVAQKGREKTYEKYYRTHEVKRSAYQKEGHQKGCVDHIILLDQFADIVTPSVQEELRSLNTIFIHNRYFWVYCNFDEIENSFNVPIYGTRHMVRLEERDVEHNQYWLLQQAGIRSPKLLRKEDLDEHFVKNKGGPLIVKVNEAERAYERAFFLINTEAEYHERGKKMIAEGKITEEGLKKAVIEEFIVGAQVNFNFFYSPLSGDLELMGTDARRQTSLDGFLRLDTETQGSLLHAGYSPTMIETGHIAVTIKESLLEKAFEIGEKFVAATQKHSQPGIIGPFALQGAVASENGREELVIFDVSMRIPGSPGTRFTPYTGYLWGRDLSYGERIAMEIKAALEHNKLSYLLT